MRKKYDFPKLETFSTVQDTNVKYLGLCILANLSNTKSNEILIDLMEHYDIFGLSELNEEQVLTYLHDRFNIL